MGLPASQRKILERIENALRGSDPRLASLFSIFTRLTHEEEMPRIEEIRAKLAIILLRIRYRLVAFGRWFGAPSRARLRTALFFPVALAFVAGTVLVGAWFPHGNRCPATRGMVSTAQTVSRSKFCTPLTSPAILGR
jgi:hypothetical protein